MSEFISLPAIVVICYLIGFACKTFGNDNIDRFIPCICGISGAILGIIMFITIPDYIAAENWAVALAIGIVSGFAATGINQFVKQIKNN